MCYQINNWVNTCITFLWQCGLARSLKGALQVFFNVMLINNYIITNRDYGESQGDLVFVDICLFYILFFVWIQIQFYKFRYSQILEDWSDDEGDIDEAIEIARKKIIMNFLNFVECNIFIVEIFNLLFSQSYPHTVRENYFLYSISFLTLVASVFTGFCYGLIAFRKWLYKDDGLCKEDDSPNTHEIRRTYIREMDEITRATATGATTRGAQQKKRKNEKLFPNINNNFLLQQNSSEEVHTPTLKPLTRVPTPSEVRGRPPTPPAHFSGTITHHTQPHTHADYSKIEDEYQIPSFDTT